VFVESRRFFHSERFPQPSGQAAVRVRGNEPGAGCLHRQRQRWPRHSAFQGNTYPFNVGGLGIGGIGVSTIEARGDVYGLRRLRDFPGAYAQGRYGFALGSTSAGDLWLQNEHGVIMRLNAKRKGLMLSLGGDAVVISMNQ
jgi:hypothetical protein